MRSRGRSSARWRGTNAPTWRGSAIASRRSRPSEVIEEHDFSGLNRPLEENVPTVDIVMFHSDNTEVTWDQLREEFTTADNIFRTYGVQLNLLRAFQEVLPERLETIRSSFIPDEEDSEHTIPVEGETE